MSTKDGHFTKMIKKYKIGTLYKFELIERKFYEGLSYKAEVFKKHKLIGFWLY